MGADEPGFDVAEEGMDDWEEGAGIGGFVLNHWRVLQMLGGGGIAAAITPEPLGQQTGPRRDIVFLEGPELDRRRGRQHPDAGGARQESALPPPGLSRIFRSGVAGR